MDKIEDKDGNFTWIGKSRKDATSNRRAKLHYDSFRKGSLQVSVQDHVLIRNDDSLEPENVDFCFIGKILDLYEKVGVLDPYCCRVQWYSRLSEIPPLLQGKIEDGDYTQELILDDCSSWSDEVDAESIFNKCCVIQLSKNVPVSTVPDMIGDQPVFFFRYATDGKHLRDASSSKVVKAVRRPVLDLSQEDITVNHEKSTQKLEKKSLEKTWRHSVRSPVLEMSQVDLTQNHPESVHNTKKEHKISSKKSETNGRMSVSSQTRCRVKKQIGEKPLNERTVENEFKSDKKSKVLSVQEEHLNEVNNTPSKGVLQPTPVKSFYSSEKKCRILNGVDATRARRTLPFDLPGKDSDFKNKVSEEPKKSSENGLKSKTGVEPKTPSLVRRQITSSFLLNKENEISPYQKTRITRSGRKVKLPNYLEYWDSYSVSSNKSNKSRQSSVNLSESSSSSGEEEIEPLQYGKNNKRQSSVKKKSRLSSDSLSESCSSSIEEENEPPQSVKKTKRRGPVKKKFKKTPISLLRPRKAKHETPKTPLEEARAHLHVSAVPDSLPCRENEFSNIFTFLEGKLLEKRGGCMYISGVPGTGKTATVHEVMRSLKESEDLGHLPPFNFVEINALRLTNPQQIYVHILKDLKGVDATASHALDLLRTHFEEGRQKQMTVLMLDELDMLRTKRQDVLYNMFHWPSLPKSRLIVLAIANTMDLPERLLANKIVSRLGLTRMSFQPYTFKQLQEIIMSRIQGLGAFNPDAVQLVARKVAAVSGDARRALDICRRATELVNTEIKNKSKAKEDYLVGMKQVDAAVQEMFCSSKICAIRNISTHEQLFLKAVVAEFLSTGVEESNFNCVARQYTTLCRMEGVPVLNMSALLSICSQLYDTRILLLENGKADVYQRIKLNISIDDINYALKDK